MTWLGSVAEVSFPGKLVRRPRNCLATIDGATSYVNKAEPSVNHHISVLESHC